MFNKYLTLILIFIAILWIPVEVFGVKIWGGRIEDILVLEEGAGPGQVNGNQRENSYFLQYAIDIDVKGNIYLSDPGNARIQIFSSNGKFMSEIQLSKLLKDRKGRVPSIGSQISCDNEGSVYLVDLVKEIDRLRLIKFLPDGKMVTQIEFPDSVAPSKNRYHYSGFISVNGISFDYFGNLYFYPYDFEHKEEYPAHEKNVSKIYMYEKGKHLKTHFYIQGGKIPPQVVQKADSLGRVLFLRNKYLHISNVKDIGSSGFKDSLEGPQNLTSDYRLIGFDANFNIYLVEDKHWVYQTSEIASAHTYVTIIHKYKVVKDKLQETGRVFLNFNDPLEEEQERPEIDVSKRYIVNGQGEIFFLHGTMHKLTLTKIIFEELKSEK